MDHLYLSFYGIIYCAPHLIIPSSTSTRRHLMHSVSWCIVPLVLPLTFCANIQTCHGLEDGKLWCYGVESREGGREDHLNPDAN